MMKKFINWVLNHLKTVLAIITFTTTFVVVGLVMLNSYNNYKNYEAEYYATDLATRSEFPPAPKGIFLNDSYKSKYKNRLIAYDDELIAQGNKLNLSFSLVEKSFVDVEFVFTTNNPEPSNIEAIEVRDLLSKASFQVDDNLMEGEVNVYIDDVSCLIMSGFALASGDHVITVEGRGIVTLMEISIYSSSTVYFTD
ncbi:MAG: hypothetical protein GX813_01205 [Erysipelotrichia bacterium]|nr:hypothetical protein [Erysipelotrichia bacterium]